MPRAMNNRGEKKINYWLQAIGICLMFSLAVSAQEQTFDYRLEETPAVSWNALPFVDARAVAGISLLASPALSAAFNPALIPAGPLQLTATLKQVTHEAFQYWGVNQGVIAASGAQRDADFGISAAAGTWGGKRFRLAAGYSLSAVLRFPDFEQRWNYEYDQYYSTSGTFSGKEDVFFAAAAWQPASFLTLGARLAYRSGQRRISLVDFDSSYYNIGGQWVLREIAVGHSENHRTSLWAPALGFSLRLSPAWTFAAAFDYPLEGKAHRTVVQSFDNPADRVDISIDQESRDSFSEPATLLVGTAYRFRLGGVSRADKFLRLAAETRATFWSDYRYEFFGQTQPRDLRNTVEAAVGMEYGAFTARRDFFVRFGFRRDPQPLRAAGATLSAWCGGIGGRWHRWSGDFGLALYSGSVRGYAQRHLLAVFTLGYAWKGEQS